MDASDSFPWRRGVLCGVLWGVAVLLIDALTQPFGALNWQEAASFAARAGLANLAGGLVWALGAEWTANHRRKLAMFVLQLPVAVIASIVAACAPIQGLFQYSSGIGRLMSDIPMFDFTCHMIWINGLCGGVYVLGYQLTRRSMELRRHLTALQLACGDADMRLREMRLQAYRGQIRPATLLEALSDLQHRYSIGSSAGDQLFDRLVDFLRAAMPSLRGGASTLSAELAIISSYATLRNALRHKSPRWQLKILPPQPNAGPNFMPLRVLASLDRIDHCVPQGHIIEVTTDCRQDTWGVTVKIKAASLTDDERQILKRNLESALGADAIVVMGTSLDVSLDLRLPASRSIENPKTHYHELIQGAEDAVFPG